MAEQVESICIANQAQAVVSMIQSGLRSAPLSVMGLRSASALRHRRELHPHLRTQLPPVFSLTAYSVFA